MDGLGRTAHFFSGHDGEWQETLPTSGHFPLSLDPASDFAGGVHVQPMAIAQRDFQVCQKIVSLPSFDVSTTDSHCTPTAVGAVVEARKKCIEEASQFAWK